MGDRFREVAWARTRSSSNQHLCICRVAEFCCGEASAGHTATSGSGMNLREGKHGGRRGVEGVETWTEGMERQTRRSGRRDALQRPRGEEVMWSGQHVWQRAAESW